MTRTFPTSSFHAIFSNDQTFSFFFFFFFFFYFCLRATRSVRSIDLDSSEDSERHIGGQTLQQPSDSSLKASTEPSDSSDSNGGRAVDFESSTAVTKKIQKRYRKTGISFGSYNIDDEDSSDSGETEAPPPSDSLLGASPAYLSFKNSTNERLDGLRDRLDVMEKGLSRSESRMEDEDESDSSFQYAFASGGAGNPFDFWAGAILVSHIAMITFTILFLLKYPAVDLHTWMGVFLVFLFVTLAKWLSTMNKVTKRPLSKKSGEKATRVIHLSAVKAS